MNADRLNDPARPSSRSPGRDGASQVHRLHPAADRPQVRVGEDDILHERGAAVGREPPDRLAEQPRGAVLVSGHEPDALPARLAGLGRGDDGRQGMDAGRLVQHVRRRLAQREGLLRVGDRLAVLAQPQAGQAPAVVGIPAGGIQPDGLLEVVQRQLGRVGDDVDPAAAPQELALGRPGAMGGS